MGPGGTGARDHLGTGCLLNGRLPTKPLTFMAVSTAVARLGYIPSLWPKQGCLHLAPPPPEDVTHLSRTSEGI